MTGSLPALRTCRLTSTRMYRMQAQAEAWYFSHYAYHWNEDNYRQALASIPTGTNRRWLGGGLAGK